METVLRRELTTGRNVPITGARSADLAPCRSVLPTRQAVCARFGQSVRVAVGAAGLKCLGRRPQSVAERAAAILDDYGRREGAE